MRQLDLQYWMTTDSHCRIFKNLLRKLINLIFFEGRRLISFAGYCIYKRSTFAVGTSIDNFCFKPYSPIWKVSFSAKQNSTCYFQLHSLFDQFLSFKKEYFPFNLFNTFACSFPGTTGNRFMLFVFISKLNSLIYFSQRFQYLFCSLFHYEFFRW